MKNSESGMSRLKILACLLPLLLAAPLLAQDENPPGRAARLSLAEGNVSLQPDGGTDWSQATLNYTLTKGDRLYTDQGARAEVEVGPFAVRMSEATDLTLANLDDQTMQLGLGEGSVRVSVYELPGGNTVEIDTPNGALIALAPGSYRVDVDPNNGTRVIVNNGSLQVTGGGTNETIQAGQAVELSGTGPIQVSSVDFPGQDDFDQWSAERDRRVETSRSRQYVNPYYVPGAEDLDTYGRWQTVPDYGPVWYPSDVSSDWVPYRYGHWAWIQPWGWTWVEDEPWGYSPFHYGRWALIGSRWGWVPGPVVVAPVYSPALVAFVGGGGFSIGVSFGGGGGLAAWFPLGPQDPFIPWYHYRGDYLRRVNVTNVRNVTNITNITNVTNVTNVQNINVQNVHYQYRTVAATAVPAHVLQSGQPVSRQVVHVAPQQLAKAQVVAHPDVAPVRTAFYGGKAPVKAPTVRARITAPPAASAGTGRPAPAQPSSRGIPEGRPAPTPRGVPSAPAPATAPSRVEAGRPAATPRGIPSAPAPATAPSRVEAGRPTPGQPAPTFQRRTFTLPPSAPPRVITRTPPPPRDVPFAKQEPALDQHPGRPLEPQQRENLRQGRPAGPMRDREILPHASAPNPPARNQAKPAPNSKSESRKPPKN